MKFGIRIKPFQGDEHCGDQYYIKEFGENGGKMLIAVIDGLGHGVWAEHAARKACEYLESSYHMDLPAIFQGCDQFLKHTVGVAMSVAVIDSGNRSLTFAGIGNVESRIVIPPGRSFSMSCDYGIVGGGFRKVEKESCSFKPGNLLIMHSDGISAKFDVFSYRMEVRADPQKLADDISRDFSRDHDDSIVLVGKWEKEIEEEQRTR